MRAKRTHRRTDAVLFETLESRRLLSSGPTVAINYFNSNLDFDTSPAPVPYEAQASTSSPISWITGVPLHVTAVAAGGQSGTTFDEFSDYETNPNHAIEAEWQWNFGDPSGEYNQLNGFNAAHIYNSTGTYPLTLTVTDEDGNPTTETINVDVSSVANFDPSSPNYKGTFYVADVTGPGEGTIADPYNISDLQNALAGTNNYPPIPSDSQILFKNGDEFSVSSQLNITQNNILISNYSAPSNPSDVLPVLDNPEVGNPSITVNVETSSINAVISNINFTDSAGGAEVINPAGTNLTVENCQLSNFSNECTFVDAQTGSTEGLLLEGNQVSDTNVDDLGYFLFDDGAADVVVLGNTVYGNTGTHDAIIRFEGTEPDSGSGGPVNSGTDSLQRILVTENKLYNWDGTEDGQGNSVVRVYSAQYIDINQNTLVTGGYKAVELGLLHEPVPRTAGDTDPLLNEKDVILEANSITGSVILGGGSYYVMYRNNILTATPTDTSLVEIDAPVTYYNDASHTADRESTDNPATDIFILNNTAVTSLDYGEFVSVGGLATAITLENNLYVTTNSSFEVGNGGLGGFVTVIGSDLSDFLLIAGNVWPQVTADGWANREDSGEGNAIDPPDEGAMYIGPESPNADPQSPGIPGSEYFVSRDEWNALLDSDFGSADSFASVSLASSYIPTSETGMASSIPGVLDDFYGKPRPSSGWTAGAVEPDLDISSLGYVYLQTDTSGNLDVWNSGSATGPSVDSTPDLIVPLAGFLETNVTALSGSSNTFTLDLTDGVPASGNDFYFAGISTRFSSTSFKVIGPSSTPAALYEIVSGAPTAVNQIGFSNSAFSAQIPSGVFSISLTPDATNSTYTDVTFGDASSPAFAITPNAAGAAFIDEPDPSDTSVYIVGTPDETNSFWLGEEYIWQVSGSYSENISFGSSTLGYLDIVAGSTNDTLTVTDDPPSAAIINFQGLGDNDAIIFEDFPSGTTFGATAPGSNGIGSVDIDYQFYTFTDVPNVTFEGSGSGNVIDFSGTSGVDNYYNYNNGTADVMLMNGVAFEYSGMNQVNLDTIGGNDTFTEGYGSFGAANTSILSIYIASNNLDFEGEDGVASITLASLAWASGATHSGIPVSW